MSADDCCACCTGLREELDEARKRIEQLETELESSGDQLSEALNLIELQEADLARYRSREQVQPNCPERVPHDDLQLAFTQVLADSEVANDDAVTEAEAAADEMASADGNDADTSPSDGADGDAKQPQGSGKRRRRGRSGRGGLDLSKLPTETVEQDPPEVIAAGGVGFTRIGQDVSERVAFRPAQFLRLRVVRNKYISDEEAARLAARAQLEPLEAALDAPIQVLVPAVPECLWPRHMADPSAVANVIISKYGDLLPLHRQERISERHGFRLPRSTQCGWLSTAYSFTYRIVTAMLDDSRANAFCIATDATGAPVKGKGGCDSWHIFVLLADRDHVLFQHDSKHTSKVVQDMLRGFSGYLLADAASIYDALFIDGSIIETACWQHARRYFWRALPTERELALQALSIIAKLFEVERRCRPIPMPERTLTRRRLAEPVLALLDEWVERNAAGVTERTPLAAALTYYKNQRLALRRFLEHGQLRIDNAPSEQALRNLVLGRHNWMYFANETGLKWYTTFRSLIASCALHDLNPQLYLEQVLRLAPHWPITRMLELSPKCWSQTVEALDERQRLIITPPWELGDSVVDRQIITLPCEPGDSGVEQAESLGRVA